MLSDWRSRVLRQVGRWTHNNNIRPWKDIVLVWGYWYQFFCNAPQIVVMCHVFFCNVSAHYTICLGRGGYTMKKVAHYKKLVPLTCKLAPCKLAPKTPNKNNVFCRPQTISVQKGPKLEHSVKLKVLKFMFRYENGLILPAICNLFNEPTLLETETAFTH